MSRPRRATVDAGDDAPEKKRRFTLFRSRTSDPIIIVSTSSPSCAGRPNAVATIPDSVSISPSSPSTSSSSGRAVRAGSVYSSAASDDTSAEQSAPSTLGRVHEDAEPKSSEIHEDGLPTYASATHPCTPTTYMFTRCSPFAMVLTQEGAGMATGLYHISVGVNVWIPTCTVTTVRRGPTEDGPIVAQLELGIGAAPATISVGDVCKPINQIFFRKSTTSSSRLYFVGDGSAIKWKLGPTSWQASLGSTEIASFVPTPPRKLTLQPAGHRLSDHIMISLVILMREHLTPLAGMRGDAAQLFNYSPHYNYQED